MKAARGRAEDAEVNAPMHADHRRIDHTRQHIHDLAPGPLPAASEQSDRAFTGLVERLQELIRHDLECS